VSLEERFTEGQKRYKGRFGELGPADEERREKSVAAAREIERLLCARGGLHPEDITDASVAPIIEELRNYKIT
jgi:hypothetical protein